MSKNQNQLRKKKQLFASLTLFCRLRTMKKLKIKEKNTHKEKNNTPNFDIAIIFFQCRKICPDRKVVFNK